MLIDESRLQLQPLVRRTWAPKGQTPVIANWDRHESIWPVFLAGDKGYRAEWIDEYLVEQGILPVIPSREDEDQSQRLAEFDKGKYRQRNIVERLIGWLKECRGILTRFQKRAANFLGMVKMAFIERYLRLMC